MEIEDGRGRGYRASVSESNRFNVSAKIDPRSFYVSRDDGLAFKLISIDSSSDAGDYVLYIKNTSDTKNLFVKEIHFTSVNAALWKVWIVTGTASGTAITATNLNISSGRTASISGYGNGAVSGLTSGSILDAIRTDSNGHEHSIFEDALILGPNDAIAVEYDTGTTGASEVGVQFHYEDIGRDN